MFKDKRASEFYKKQTSSVIQNQNKSDLKDYSNQLDIDFIREAKADLRFKEVQSPLKKKQTQQVQRKKNNPQTSLLDSLDNDSREKLPDGSVFWPLKPDF